MVEGGAPIPTSVIQVYGSDAFRVPKLLRVLLHKVGL